MDSFCVQPPYIAFEHTQAFAKVNVEERKKIRDSLIWPLLATVSEVSDPD